MTTEEIVAAMEVKHLCDWCRTEHFRAYPEHPERACYRLDCECWCNGRELE